MTNEQKEAYEWALKQQFQSVAARYAKILAELVQQQEDLIIDLRESLDNVVERHV